MAPPPTRAVSNRVLHAVVDAADIDVEDLLVVIGTIGPGAPSHDVALGAGSKRLLDERKARRPTSRAEGTPPSRWQANWTCCALSSWSRSAKAASGRSRAWMAIAQARPSRAASSRRNPSRPLARDRLRPRSPAVGSTSECSPRKPLSHPPGRGRVAARGYGETLTVTRLGVTGNLKRTLASPNPCESTIETVRRTAARDPRHHGSRAEQPTVRRRGRRPPRSRAGLRRGRSTDRSGCRCTGCCR